MATVMPIGFPDARDVTQYGCSMGWARDIPDPRDYTLKTDEAARFKADLPEDQVPASKVIDGLKPPRMQQELSSCVAHAVTYLYESHIQIAGLGNADLSRLFVYKVMRNLLGWQGDRGGFLRSGMQTIVMFGVPPEKFYPYDVQKFDDEPSAFHYAMAQSYQALTYYRLDPFGTPASKIILRARTNIALNRACVLGFIVYTIDKKTGNIMIPQPDEKYEGGHAVTAVGYDDARVIRHADGTETRGAFKCANWWGEEFGDNGHVWLPYWYVEKGLATDWWTMMSAEWLDLGQFGRSGVAKDDGKK